MHNWNGLCCPSARKSKLLTMILPHIVDPAHFATLPLTPSVVPPDLFAQKITTFSPLPAMSVCCLLSAPVTRRLTVAMRKVPLPPRVERWLQSEMQRVFSRAATARLRSYLGITLLMHLIMKVLEFHRL